MFVELSVRSRLVPASSSSESEGEGEKRGVSSCSSSSSKRACCRFSMGETAWKKLARHTLAPNDVPVPLLASVPPPWERKERAERAL